MLKLVHVAITVLGVESAHGLLGNAVTSLR